MTVAGHPPVHHPGHRPDSRREQHPAGNLPGSSGHHEESTHRDRTRRHPGRRLDELQRLGAGRRIEGVTGQPARDVEGLIRRHLHAGAGATADSTVDEPGASRAKGAVAVEDHDRTHDRPGTTHPDSVSPGAGFRPVGIRSAGTRTVSRSGFDRSAVGRLAPRRRLHSRREASRCDQARSTGPWSVRCPVATPERWRTDRTSTRRRW